MRRRLAVAALATAASLALLSGCAATTDPAITPATPPDVLTVWADPARAEALSGTFADFEKATGAVVHVVKKDLSAIRSDYVAAADDRPDVFLGSNTWLGSLTAQGLLAPIAVDDPSAFQPVTVQAMNIDGTGFGLPVSMDNVALIRNTDLAPDAPASFADLIETGQALVEDGSALYPFTVQTGTADAGDPYHLYALETSFGAPIFGSNADGSTNAADLQIGNAGGQAFAAALAGWAADGVITPNVDGTTALTRFTTGESPYIITGRWNLSAIKKAGFGYSIEAIPSAGTLAARPFVGVQGFFVTAQSAHLELAQQLVSQYLGSASAQTAMFAVDGHPPALLASSSAITGDPDALAFGAVGATGVPSQSAPEMGSVWAPWGAAESAILSGADPTSTWTTMTQTVTTAIAAR